MIAFQSFVTCSVGIWKVGVVTTAFGVCTSVFGVTMGLLVKHIGRLGIYIAGKNGAKIGKYLLLNGAIRLDLE